MSISAEPTNRRSQHCVPAGAGSALAAAKRCGATRMHVRDGEILFGWVSPRSVAAVDAAALLAAVRRTGVLRLILVGAPEKVLRAFGVVAGDVGFGVLVQDRPVLAGLSAAAAI